jgi:hypothetical protein
MTAPDDRELEEVFDTSQETEAMMVQGLLESAGIESVITSDVGARDVLPVGAFIVKVSAAEAEEARNIIENYQDNPPDVELAEAEEEQEG